MVGIAKVTTTCKVCGSKIIKGVSTIAWSPAVKGSARHEGCFGQPDRFEANGTKLGDGLDAIIKKPTSTTFQPIPVDASTCADLSKAQLQSLNQGDMSVFDTPQPTPLANDPLSQMLAAAIAPYLKTLVDENKVRQIVKQVATQKSAEELKIQQAAIDKAVKEAVAERGVVTIAVKQLNGTTTKLEGLQHKSTDKLLRLMLMRKNVYMHGPTGSGKSTAARKCAAAIKTETHPDGLPFYYVSLNPQSSPTRIEGYQTPHGEYVMTLFRRAYEFGGVFCADEVDNSMGNLWTSVNNAIDSDLASFPDGMVKRHQDFVFVGTGNTNLSGDSVYRDRKALDKATVARFVFLYFDYDPGLERAVVLARNPNALPWLQFVHKLRAFSKVSNPSLYAYTHPRACYDGADMLANGFSVAEAADMVIFKESFDATAKLAALQANPLPQESMQ